MNSKRIPPPLILRTVIICSLIASAQSAFGLGGDYPNDRPVHGQTNWLKGMKELVNIPNRVHGFFVNFEDIFFFSGTTNDFTAFLRDYAQIQGVVKHPLILHKGVGEAKSPWWDSAAWGRTAVWEQPKAGFPRAGFPCDWKLYACPKGVVNAVTLLSQHTNSVEVIQKAAREPGYVLEVHFWVDSRISLDQVTVPPNLEVKKE
jgi:hypothetical protein